MWKLEQIIFNYIHLSYQKKEYKLLTRNTTPFQNSTICCFSFPTPSKQCPFLLNIIKTLKIISPIITPSIILRIFIFIANLNFIYTSSLLSSYITIYQSSKWKSKNPSSPLFMLNPSSQALSISRAN